MSLRSFTDPGLIRLIGVLNNPANLRHLSTLAAGCVLVAGSCSLAFAEKAPNWDKVLEKGYEQLTLGNTREAAQIFAQKIQKYPNSAQCHLGYGKALKRTGKLSEAKAEFRTATQLEPALGDAFYELGASCESDKEYENAVQAFQRYLELKPDAARRQNVPDRIRFLREHM